MHKLLLVIALVGVCACGSTTTAAQSSPSQAPCNISGAASADWPSPSSAPATPGIVSANAIGNVLTLTFRTGTPAFEITPQAQANFTVPASGQTFNTVNLAGNAGVLITLHGFRGDIDNFAGEVPASSLGPVLVEVKKIGDFEGVVSFAAGTHLLASADVSSSGSKLRITFGGCFLPGFGF